MTKSWVVLAVLALCCGVGLFAAGSVHAQSSYPSQPVRLMVPYAPGGLPDTVARIAGQRLQDRFGQSVVVENRPGGNGNIAAAALATSPPDGYTLMVTDSSLITINPHIYSKLAYQPERDFVPVVMLARAPLFLAVHPKVPVSTLAEFIAYVKAHPGQLLYGSSGVGSTHHLTMEGVKAALKLDITHVPFKGTGQSVPALLGGHVDALFSAYPSLSGAVAANSVKLLATNGAERSADAPDIPALAELIPGFDFAPIIGILARSGTPHSVIDKIAAEGMAVARDPEVARKLATVGIEALPGGPEDYGRRIKSESERVAEVVQAAGIKLD
ncbi:MAG: Bug family tripartite tricarboxylate transporter substrate binding protein [Xanthobacteraceae bacterium]